MEIIGGLDLHRKQITFDYLSIATGELSRGKIVPRDKAGVPAVADHLRIDGGSLFR